MSGCCGEVNSNTSECNPCSPPSVGEKKSKVRTEIAAFKHFSKMVPNALEYATAEHDKGRPVVGIMCEFTPREVIMAAGGMPACLCGGSNETIPAAEEVLPSNLCPLIKSTYGYARMGTNPFLEMSELLVAETTCDGKKKMYELLKQKTPMHVLELPQKPDDEDALIHWVAELRKLRADLEERFDKTISDDDLRDAIKLMNRERGLRRELAALMKMDRPPLTGRELLELKSIISGIPADLDVYEKAIEDLKKGESPVAADAVRVMLTGVPTAHGAERVLEIIEEQGGVVVVQENCTGLKPIMEDIDENADDPIVAIAEKYFHLPCSVMHGNHRRETLVKELIAEYKVEAVVDLSWHACLTYDIESVRMKELVEEELDLPYLRISTDYSPNDSARIGLRVQALLERAAAPIL